MVLLWVDLCMALLIRSDGHSEMKYFNKSFIKILHFADTQMYNCYIKKCL